jgi:hypothetical protein
MRVENTFKVIDISWVSLSEQTRNNLIPEFIDRRYVGEHIINPYLSLQNLSPKDRQKFQKLTKDLMEMVNLATENDAAYVRLTK